MSSFIIDSNISNIDNSSINTNNVTDSDNAINKASDYYKSCSLFSSNEWNKIDTYNDKIVKKLIQTCDDYDENSDNNNYVIKRIDKATLFNLIITAPHGGSHTNKDNNKFIERYDGENVVKKSDLFTLELLYEIDNYLYMKLKLRPYLVTTTVHRRYIDCNRGKEFYPYAENCKYTENIYNNYHESISNAINHKNNKIHHRILLIDIHGYANTDDSIIIGTRNLTTCNKDVIYKEGTGFLSILRNNCDNYSNNTENINIKKIKVLPEINEPDLKDYSGGYTVEYHTSYNKNVDAVQLEFAKSLRLNFDKRKEIAKFIGDVIINYLINNNLIEK